MQLSSIILCVLKQENKKRFLKEAHKVDMISDVFVTKLGMTQAWSKDGKRLAVTRCGLSDLHVVAVHSVAPHKKYGSTDASTTTIIELGFGQKKTKNMKKPLLEKIKKSGFSLGMKHFRGVQLAQNAADTPKVGDTIDPLSVLSVGDVVCVQGTSKGKGFAGGMKRWGFAGGPKTHGQSDRARAVGSIGAGTTPGRVWLGKKMPGNKGNDLKTVEGLVILHLDTEKKELWLSGPVPGAAEGFLRIRKTGKNKKIELDYRASSIESSNTDVQSDDSETTV